MAVLSTIGILFGVVLGLHFKVFVLVPAIGFAGPVVAAAGIASGESVWQVALSTVLVAITIQMGYLGGTVVRYLFDATRAKFSSRARRSARNAVGRIA